MLLVSEAFFIAKSKKQLPCIHEKQSTPAGIINSSLKNYSLKKHASRHY